MHNRRLSHSSEIVGMLRQLLHKVLAEQEEILRQQMHSLEEEVRSKSSSSSSSSTPYKKKCKITRDLTVQIIKYRPSAHCPFSNKVAAVHDSLEDGLWALTYTTYIYTCDLYFYTHYT